MDVSTVAVNDAVDDSASELQSMKCSQQVVVRPVTASLYLGEVGALLSIK